MGIVCPRWSDRWRDLRHGSILTLTELLDFAARAASVSERLAQATARLHRLPKRNLFGRALLAPNDELSDIAKVLRSTLKLCSDINLESTSDATGRLAASIADKEKPIRLDYLQDDILEIRNRLEDDLKRRQFYYLDATHEKYYREAHEIFPADVLKAFPVVSRDIEEASKCFALGRYTASVFHLMRVMEHGMDALAIELGVAKPYQTWDKKIGKIAEVLTEELRKTYSPSSPLAGRLDFFKQATERLTAVQHALRNETMHARSHYGQADADDIYRSTVRFIEKLSEKLAEASSEQAV
jgi:hypothetical protein